MEGCSDDGFIDDPMVGGRERSAPVSGDGAMLEKTVIYDVGADE